MGEFALIDRIKRRVRGRDDVLLGIGDDAAVLRVPAGFDLVVSMDTLLAGRHFPLSTTPEDIGYKALAVNLSDLAAMGAVAAWATLGLTLPRPDNAWLDRFCDGFFELADAHGVALVGGDTVRGTLSITVGIHGLVGCGQALKRSGAGLGDDIWVTGTLGDAALGLAALKAGSADAHPELLKRLNRPTPRLHAASVLRDFANAAIDVSDGLLADLTHLARASGAGARIDLGKLPTSEAARQFVGANEYQLRLHQLSGGDDYELLFTALKANGAQIALRMQECGVAASVIGEITGNGSVDVIDSDGRRFIPALRGFDHFA